VSVKAMSSSGAPRWNGCAHIAAHAAVESDRPRARADGGARSRRLREGFRRTGRDLGPAVLEN